MLRIPMARNKSKRPALARVCAAIVGCLICTGPGYGAQAAERPCVPAADGETFDVDFAQAPLGDVARLVSCAGELAIMFSPQTLSGKTITVLAPRRVDLRTLVQLFRAAVVEAGLVMERRGAYYLIRPVTGGGAAPAQPPSKRRSSQGR